jgi:endonuclease/exonuclease/phosphatase family metal-dependent hydrolase
VLRLTLILLIGAALGMGCTATHPAKGTNLTVLTYNIHHGAGMDGKIDLDRIADVIRASQADLVALQEVDVNTRRSGSVDQAGELARLTGLHKAFGVAMDFDGGQYGDAVLSRLPIKSARVQALGFTPGNRREPRCAVLATVALPDGNDLSFISTHLDHTGGSSDRLMQARKINAAFSAIEAPAVLAGDFNCEPESTPIRELQSRWLLMDGGDHSPTCPSNAPTECIDHVFVCPAGRWTLVEYKIIDQRIASDHLPVAVRLELR